VGVGRDGGVDRAGHLRRIEDDVIAAALARSVAGAFTP